MRAILIDPWSRTITEVDVTNPDSGASIYAALSHESHKAGCFTVLGLSEGESLFLDDDGLLSPGVPLWRLDGYPQPLAGRGLVLGVTESGDSRDTRADLDALASGIFWTDAETSGDLTPSYTATRAGKAPASPRTFADMVDTAFHGGNCIPQPVGTHAKRQQWPVGDL